MSQQTQIEPAKLAFHSRLTFWSFCFHSNRQTIRRTYIEISPGSRADYYGAISRVSFRHFTEPQGHIMTATLTTDILSAATMARRAKAAITSTDRKHARGWKCSTRIRSRLMGNGGCEYYPGPDSVFADRTQ